MGIREILDRIKLRKEKFRDYKDDDRIRNTIQERKKSHNERELERIMEERRQARIKMQLKRFRKEEQRNWWKPTMMNNNPNLLKERQILKEPCIFKTRSDILR